MVNLPTYGASRAHRLGLLDGSGCMSHDLLHPCRLHHCGEETSEHQHGRSEENNVDDELGDEDDTTRCRVPLGVCVHDEHDADHDHADAGERERLATLSELGGDSQELRLLRHVGVRPVGHRPEEDAEHRREGDGNVVEQADHENSPCLRP